VVFHTAAKAGVAGTRAEFERVNVEGTRNVLDACREHRVARLVYTSTPSVISAGGDLAGVDESFPYPDHFEAEYPRTKAMAEKLVLGANGPELRTVAIDRISSGDRETRSFVPRIIARAKLGQLRQVEGGRSLVDTVYVDNAAEAHLLAADRLEPGSPAAGKAYFITQGAPIAVGRDDQRDPCGGGASSRDPERLAAGGICRGLGAGDRAPRARARRRARMTRFLAKQLGTAHWFDISAARRDLQYTPRVSTQEGLRRLAKALRGE